MVTAATPSGAAIRLISLIRTAPQRLRTSIAAVAEPPVAAEAVVTPARSSATSLPQPVDELDATAVRRIWDDVLEVAKRLKRRTHALLLSGPAQVVDVRANVLVLGFASGPVERQFNTGDNADVLREALTEVLGVDWRIETTLSGQAAVDADTAAGVAPPAPPSPSEAMAADRAPARRASTAARGSAGAPQRSAAAEAAAQSVANPAPAASVGLDEAQPDDDDADDGASSLALLQRHLGATVIDDGGSE